MVLLPVWTLFSSMSSLYYSHYLSEWELGKETHTGQEGGERNPHGWYGNAAAENFLSQFFTSKTLEITGLSVPIFRKFHPH